MEDDPGVILTDRHATETGMGDTQKILLIDDDTELTALIGPFLESNGFAVAIEHDGANAIERIHAESPALIVLDLMLPGINGLEICRRVRDDFHGPIIMMTALDDDIDEVTGLEVGADDYLAKPIRPRVLLAHIRAQLRRTDKLNQSTSDSLSVHSGRLTIVPGTRTVTMRAEDIPLSSAEFDLLLLLAQHAGEVISREELHKQIFRLEYDGSDRSLDLRISRLRKKLGDDTRRPEIIKTVRNRGYLLAK